MRLARQAWAAALLLATVPAVATTVMDVALPPTQVQQVVLQAVRVIAPQREERRRYRLAVPFGSPLFPPDHDLAASAPAGSALADWLALPASSRHHDVLIVPDVDYFWNADGRRYSCQFIVHVETAAGGSSLSLVQVRPIIYAGKRFELLGRTGPGRYMDLRPASPSPQAGAELRAFLATAISPPP